MENIEQNLDETTNVEVAQENQVELGESIALTEEQIKTKKGMSTFAYLVCISGIIYFFMEGGFSLGFGWWIVAALFLLSVAVIYGLKEDNTKDAIDTINGCLIINSACLLLMVGCAQGYDSEGYNFVVNRLRAPSTADLVDYASKSKARDVIKEKMHVTYSDDLDFECYSIDSQNGFGGTNRHEYIVAFWKGKPVMFDTDCFNSWFKNGGINISVLLSVNCGLSDNDTKIKYAK